MLSASELQTFHEAGYVVRREMMAPERVAELSAQIDGLHEKMAEHPPEGVGIAWEDEQAPGRPPRIRQLMNSERVSAILDAFSRSDELLSIMEQLIGPDLYLYHSKLLMKAARDGTFTPWHQDWGYWHRSFDQPTQVNCMLAIDPADEANGAIRFVPGSHRQGLIEHIQVPSNSFSTALPGDLDAYDAELVEMAPGDAVFFGSLVIHGSGPNQTDRDRRANTMAFDRPGNHSRGPFPERLHRRGRTEDQVRAG